MKLSIEGSFDEIICVCDRLSEASFREILKSRVALDSEEDITTPTESEVADNEKQEKPTAADTKSKPAEEIELHIEGTPENTKKEPVKISKREEIINLATQIAREKGANVVADILKKLESKKISLIPEEKLETAFKLLEQEL